MVCGIQNTVNRPSGPHFLLVNAKIHNFIAPQQTGEVDQSMTRITIHAAPAITY
jgi:hypothetical protein